MLLAKGNQALSELEELALLLVQVPIKPALLVVLAVRIVVALLRATDLITTEEHRHTLREKQRGKKGSLTAHAQVIDARVFRWSLHAAVPRVVVVGAVLIVFAVGFVVL